MNSPRSSVSGDMSAWMPPQWEWPQTMMCSMDRYLTAYSRAALTPWRPSAFS